MKSKFLAIVIYVFFNTYLVAENLTIEAKKITLDKEKNLSIFEQEVVITTENGIIQSDYLEYDKNTNFLKLKGNVIVEDKKNNILKTNNATYDKIKKIFNSIGDTEILTSEKYNLNGQDISVSYLENLTFSKRNSTLKDTEGNKILLDNFEYNSENNIFKSVGYIKILDNKENIYEFSQIYIDTKKKEILGSDIKSFLNDPNFKMDKDNKPRVFANSINLTENKSAFNKSIFTFCNYREGDKCPPWSIQASKMLHDNKKKTIFYNNAVVKVYDIPIFYFPKLSHPDPSVDRRSGFLPPSLLNSKNLGSGISVPYFFNLDKDKNFTLTNKFYSSENPLFLGEYHQAFRNSNLLADFGYTEGYKKTNLTKKGGEKSHFFSKFTKIFIGKNNSKNALDISYQDVSNDKYLKLHKIKSKLVDYNTDTLKSYFDFSHENDDVFFGLNASIYETIKENYNDKYEYILPEVTFDKNLINSEMFGNIDLQSNFKFHNYDTNKSTNFLINDLNWNFKEINFNNGLNSKFLGQFRNINYEVKNVDLYKDNLTNEFYGALGILSEIDFTKKVNNSNHFLTPKILIRYAPGDMRQETSGSRLDPLNAYTLNRLENINNFETGLNSTVGFDYKIDGSDKNFNFSVAQIINNKENKKMDSTTGLDEKLSDLVGTSNLEINNKISLKYNFALDQNYNDLNYNEIGSSLNLNPIKIDFDYIQEKKHIGNQEYLKTKIGLNQSENGLVSFETKRNLVTNSSEFYNLSYEYRNDCLKAGLVYRREFYQDSELEPENSLLFKITLAPFGNLSSPSLN
tara:strand:- start:1812 stop:4205 length:2394 start_codon:yes stop_codon:yes gene_type:complete